MHLSGQNFVFPFYHVVSNKPSSLIKHLYPVPTEKQFRQDLDFFLRYFYPAEFEQVLKYSKNQNTNGKPLFFLSFDDGFIECSDVIAPILREKGVQAAFFINPAFVGNKKISHRQKISLIIDKVINSEIANILSQEESTTGQPINSKIEFIQFIKELTFSDTETIDKIAANIEIDFEEALKEHRPYMNIPELLQLQNDGFIIGSHSFNHAEFQHLSLEKMEDQVERSFRFLETNLNIKHRVFSFPFHDIDIQHSFFHYLRNEANVEVSFGTSGIKHDQAFGHIHRIPMELSGFSGAETIIRSEYFYYLGKSLFGKNLVKRR